MIVYVSVLLLTTGIACLVANHVVFHQNKAVPGAQGYGCVGADRRQYCNRACMALLFVLLFLVSACRYELGNDYKRYLEFFRLISKNQDVPTEPGFNAVVRILQFFFGPETYLSIFAFCAAFTLLLMLKALYDLSSRFAFSFFLFMCFGYFFYSMNSVRYYMALALVMVSMRFILKRQYGKFAALVVLAALFHKSALLALVIYPLAMHAWKKWQYVLLVLFMASMFFLQDFYLKIILFLYPTYENTELLDGGTSPVNIVRCAAVLVFGLLYYRQAIRDNLQAGFYYHLNLFAFFLYTCCSFLPEISRIGYYMTIGHIFLLPMIVEGIPDKRLQRFWKSVIAAAALVYFAAFLFKAGDPLIKLLPYHTWFFEQGPRFAEFGE